MNISSKSVNLKLSHIHVKKCKCLFCGIGYIFLVCYNCIAACNICPRREQIKQLTCIQLRLTCCLTVKVMSATVWHSLKHIHLILEASNDKLVTDNIKIVTHVLGFLY